MGGWSGIMGWLIRHPWFQWDYVLFAMGLRPGSNGIGQQRSQCD